MAVRQPLYWTGSEFRAMDAGQRRQLTDLAIYLYAQDPSVTLRQLIATGNLNPIYDSRMQAGDSTQRADRFATEAETGDISKVTITWDQLDQVDATGTAYPTDVSNRRFPVYADADNNIRAMNLVDFIDTFIKPAITYMTTPLTGSNDRRGGTYTIIGDNVVDRFNPPDYLEVQGVYPVYIDTTADLSAYSASQIPEIKDQPANSIEYYLYKYKGFATKPVPSARPLYVTATNDLREFSENQLDQVLGAAIKAAAVDQNGGARINYDFQYSAPVGLNGSIRGTLVDSILNGDSASGYTTRFVNADSYRTQEFPNGIPTTANTYYFTVEMV